MKPRNLPWLRSVLTSTTLLAFVAATSRARPAHAASDIASQAAMITSLRDSCPSAVLANLPALERPLLKKRTLAVLDTLLHNWPLPRQVDHYGVTIVSSSCPVATVCPAGEVFVSEELVSTLTDHQLEAVFAHEIAHAEFNHHLGRVLTETMMAQAFATSFEALDRALSKNRGQSIHPFSGLSSTIASILATGFGYAQEWEADQTSALYCLQRFHSTAPLALALDRVSTPECTPISNASLLMTHPRLSARIAAANSAVLSRFNSTATPLSDSTGHRIGSCRPIVSLVADEERIVSDTLWVPAKHKRAGRPDSVRTYPKRFSPDRRLRLYLSVDSTGRAALSHFKALRFRTDRWQPDMDFTILPESSGARWIVVAQRLSAPTHPPGRITEVRATQPREGSTAHRK